MDIRVTDIDWDTDGADVDLPKELVIDATTEHINDPDQELAN